MNSQYVKLWKESQIANIYVADKASIRKNLCFGPSNRKNLSRILYPRINVGLIIFSCYMQIYQIIYAWCLIFFRTQKALEMFFWVFELNLVTFFSSALNLRNDGKSCFSAYLIPIKFRVPLIFEPGAQKLKGAKITLKGGGWGPRIKGKKFMYLFKNSIKDSKIGQVTTWNTL